MPGAQQRQSPLPQAPGQPMQQPAQAPKMGGMPAPMTAQPAVPSQQQQQQMSPQSKQNKLMPTNKPHGLDPVLIQTERENMLVGESRCRTVYSFFPH